MMNTGDKFAVGFAVVLLVFAVGLWGVGIGDACRAIDIPCPTCHGATTVQGDKGIRGCTRCGADGVIRGIYLE